MSSLTVEVQLGYMSNVTWPNPENRSHHFRLSENALIAVNNGDINRLLRESVKLASCFYCWRFIRLKYINVNEKNKNKKLLYINPHMWWTLVMIIFSVYFEGILSKTASYLTRHMQNAWTGSNETWLAEYGSLLCITPNRMHESAQMCSWYRGCIECRLERIEPLESQKTLQAAGVRKPVSFKLALANTWRLLKLKVNIYRFVLLNFNKVIRPGESLHFYWHIKMNLNS